MIKGFFKDIFQYASPEAQKDVVSKLTLACSALDGKNDDKSNNIGSLCKDYHSGKINDKEFFFNVASTAIPNKVELSKINVLEKYNSVINFLSRNKIYYIMILLAGNLSSFLIILAEISFSMGVLILLPYASIITYNNLCTEIKQANLLICQGLSFPT